MKRHRVRGFQHGTDVPARSAPLGIGSAIESKEKKLAPALRLTACNHLKRYDCQGGSLLAGFCLGMLYMRTKPLQHRR